MTERERIETSNQLRQRIWDLNEDLSSMLSVDPAYRNQSKISRLENEIQALEDQIREVRGH